MKLNDVYYVSRFFSKEKLFGIYVQVFSREKLFKILWSIDNVKFDEKNWANFLRVSS